MDGIACHHTARRGVSHWRLLALLALAAVAMLSLGAGSALAASCLGKRATIVSSAAKIVGGKAPDVIVVKGGGNHTVKGEGGNDKICGGSGDDQIDSGKGVDSVDGGPGNDTITGGKGPDRLAGGGGDDYLNGEQGSDDVGGGDGTDTILGDKGNDALGGGSGDDKIDGGPGDEKAVDGEAGTDTLFGGAGTDAVDGGDGDGDIVRGDAGTDALDGGPGGGDIISYESASRDAVQVNLGSGQAKGDGHDSIAGFEAIVGSPQGDTLVGDGSPNKIDGGVGDDKLEGGGGGDEAFGGAGTDSCSNFAAESSCGPERAPPANSAFAILNKGLAGASLVVQGSQGSDQLTVARSGESWAISNNGAVFAGDGCANSGANAVACPGNTQLALIVVTGGNGDDGIAIDASVPGNAKVRVNGNAGSDAISGGPGDDVLESGENYNGPDSGNDTLIGNGGSDVLYSDPGGDSLQGGAGNDLLVSSVVTCQGHTYDGGPGDDTVSYARSNDALKVTLGGTGGPGGCGSPDHVLANNDSLEGSDGPDVLTGDNQSNSFLGHLGADTFVGKGGGDFIEAADDGKRDKKIDCGGGHDEASTDAADPRPISC
jgi:Ca2+-binding RTX toxin-like protein